MIENIFPRYVRVSRIICVPRTKRSRILNIPLGNCIRQNGVVVPGRIASDAVDNNAGHLKDQRILLWIVRFDRQAGIVAYHLVDDKVGLGEMVQMIRRLRAHRFWRNVDHETMHVNGSDVHWLEQKSGDCRMEVKNLASNQGLFCSFRRPCAATLRAGHSVSRSFASSPPLGHSVLRARPPRAMAMGTPLSSRIW